MLDLVRGKLLEEVWEWANKNSVKVGFPFLCLCLCLIWLTVSRPLVLTGERTKGLDPVSRLTSSALCSPFLSGFGYSNTCRSAKLLSPLVYPILTFCHCANSICQQSTFQQALSTIGQHKPVSPRPSGHPVFSAEHSRDKIGKHLLVAI